MAKSFIQYDKPLPEIPGRVAWERPDSYLVKDASAPNGWRIETSGRRVSKMLLVNKLRRDVDKWRVQGYPGASAVTERLFHYWFEEEHEISGFPVPFHYRYCLREAMETLAYLVEIKNLRDSKKLIQAYAEVVKAGMFEYDLKFQTTMDGKREVTRYFPEVDKEGTQDLPPEDLARYAFKMATGSGKTWVMAMLIVWSHFHKQRVPNSPLSTNFLILAPNVIVYQRLEKDFKSNSIFHELPLVPPEWRPFSQKVILRGDSTEPDPSCNLFLTNIQQIQLSREKELTPANAVEALLGRKPVSNLASHQRSMLERLRGMQDLIVINDEAHHVHDEDLAWSKSIFSIHEAMPQGLSLWLDFSATPKDQGGAYYPWIICDYPLAQAVEDRIVKAPVIVTKDDDKKHPTQEPEKITKDNVAIKYHFWIEAAVNRWREHYKVYKGMESSPKPVLFIMTEKNVYADAIGEYVQSKEFKFKPDEVLIIHTDSTGEITKKDLEQAREAARDIDLPGNKVKVIVSVMMLREGWDVRSVSVVLGLRPFVAKSEILPEQVIGRGLRLMTGIGPDTQTLEVLGNDNLLNVLRGELESEGVVVGTGTNPPPPPVWIYPVKEKQAYDIVLPITKPVLTHNARKVSSLQLSSFAPIYDQAELDKKLSNRILIEFGTPRVKIHETEVTGGDLPIAQEIFSTLTNKVIEHAKLTTAFAELYPTVRDYVIIRCFGHKIDIESERVRACLNEAPLQDGIARYLARKISELTVEKRTLEFAKANHKLSETKRFQWRRNLQPTEGRVYPPGPWPLECPKTIFNYVATYNDFERAFAQFLQKAKDVARFAALGTTDQGESGSQFRVDYLKQSGAIGFYHPDWIAVQKTPQGEVNWIIETKGREWEGTQYKDEAMTDWCERVSQLTGQCWQFIRINQKEFEGKKPQTLCEAVQSEATLLKS